jgi:hypothetical protein
MQENNPIFVLAMSFALPSATAVETVVTQIRNNTPCYAARSARSAYRFRIVSPPIRRNSLMATSTMVWRDILSFLESQKAFATPGIHNLAAYLRAESTRGNTANCVAYFGTKHQEFFHQLLKPQMPKTCDIGFTDASNSLIALPPAQATLFPTIFESYLQFCILFEEFCRTRRAAISKQRDRVKIDAFVRFVETRSSEYPIFARFCRMRLHSSCATSSQLEPSIDKQITVGGSIPPML